MPIIEKEFGYEKQTIQKPSFVFGYSPEINPGDKHTLVDIKKITSGNNKSRRMD